MKLPNWIPQVGRPWNYAYGDVWDAMTPNERRASWLFDAAVVVVVLGLCAAFGGFG